MNLPEFKPWPKIPRLSREIIITEKLDGTNASIYIGEDGTFAAGSRTRWITPQADNYGFAAWVEQNKEELLKLGPGHHFGEWWGKGIQRHYDQQFKQFSLFNTSRWSSAEPWEPAFNPEVGRVECARVVPILYRGEFCTVGIRNILEALKADGSAAAPGFMRPEGIIIYHVASGQLFKKTIEDDAAPKGLKESLSLEQHSAGVEAAQEVFKQKVRADKLADYPEQQ